MHPNWRFSQLPGCFMHRLKFEMYWSMTKQSKWEKLSSKENQVPHQRALTHLRVKLLVTPGHCWCLEPQVQCWSVSVYQGKLGVYYAVPPPQHLISLTKQWKGRTLDNSGSSPATAKSAGRRPQSHLFPSLVCASLWAAQCSAIEWNDKRIRIVSASRRVGRPLRHSSF